MKRTATFAALLALLIAGCGGASTHSTDDVVKAFSEGGVKLNLVQSSPELDDFGSFSQGGNSPYSVLVFKAFPLEKVPDWTESRPLSSGVRQRDGSLVKRYGENVLLTLVCSCGPTDPQFVRLDQILGSLDDG